MWLKRHFGGTFQLLNKSYNTLTYDNEMISALK